MANEFVGTRQWRAVDPTRNIAREYSVRATVDLFGRIVVEQRWGRIGCEGWGKTTSFENPEATERYIARLEACRGDVAAAFECTLIEVGRVSAPMQFVTHSSVRSNPRNR